LTPVILLGLLWVQCYLLGALLFAVMIFPFVFPVEESPAFCRWYLKAAGWFEHGRYNWHHLFTTLNLL
jgi:hypothetical protein